VLCFVRGDTSENLSERIGAVVKIALAHEAIIHGTIGPLVATAYGAHPNSPAHFGARIALVKDLRRKLGDDIKIVHGATEGCYGLFGNESFMSYTFVVPEFNAALGLLSKLDFGQTEEV
jgi:hypothetical protein